MLKITKKFCQFKTKIIFLNIIKLILEKLSIYILPDLNKKLLKNVYYSKSTKSFVYNYDNYDKKKINILRLETTNLVSELCILGKKHSTDKSPFNSHSMPYKNHRHPYTAAYDLLFSNFRHQKINFAEIGILGNASIKMFRQYFSKANIYGFEFNVKLIDKAKKDNLKKVKYYKIDVKNEKNIIKTFKKVNQKFNIIIDDSTHEFEDQIRIIKKSLNFLAPGGLMIIEDIFHSPKDLETKYIESLKNHLKLFEKIFFIECNHINKYSPDWNNDKLLVLKKK